MEVRGRGWGLASVPRMCLVFILPKAFILTPIGGCHTTEQYYSYVNELIIVIFYAVSSKLIW